MTPEPRLDIQQFWVAKAVVDRAEHRQRSDAEHQRRNHEPLCETSLSGRREIFGGGLWEFRVDHRGVVLAGESIAQPVTEALQSLLDADELADYAADEDGGQHRNDLLGLE